MKKNKLILCFVFALIFAFSVIAYSACAVNDGGASLPDQTQSGDGNGIDDSDDGEEEQGGGNQETPDNPSTPEGDGEPDEGTGGDEGGEEQGTAEPVFALAEIGEALKKKFECDEVLDLYEHTTSKNSFLAFVAKVEGGVQKMITKISIKDKDLNNFDRKSTDQIVEEISKISTENYVIQNINDYIKTLDTDRELVEGLVKKLVGEDFNLYWASITNLTYSGPNEELKGNVEAFQMKILGTDIESKKVSEINIDVSCQESTIVTGKAGYDAVINGTAGRDYRVDRLETNYIGNAILGYKQSVEDYNKYKQQING